MGEKLINKEDGSLPFSYYNPETEGKVLWTCGEDASGRITSVFSYECDDATDRTASYLENIEEANKIKETLIENGWLERFVPEINFVFPNEKESRPLNRKERRYLAKHAKKSNPFM